MENWIFLFLGAILGYLLEFTRPWVQSYIDKGIFSSRKRRMAALLRDYRYRKWLKQNPSLLGPIGVRQFFSLAIFTLLFSLFTFILVWTSYFHGGDKAKAADIFLLSVIVVVLVLVSGLRAAIKFANEVFEFDAYRIMTIKRFVELGGNPEDLDKEEGG